MGTGSKHLHSLVNGGALLPVATERRRNVPKRGGAAGPKVDSRKAGVCRVIRGGICHGCGALRVISCMGHDGCTGSHFGDYSMTAPVLGLGVGRLSKVLSNLGTCLVN